MCSEEEYGDATRSTKVEVQDAYGFMFSLSVGWLLLAVLDLRRSASGLLWAVFTYSEFKEWNFGEGAGIEFVVNSVERLTKQWWHKILFRIWTFSCLYFWLPSTTGTFFLLFSFAWSLHDALKYLNLISKYRIVTHKWGEKRGIKGRLKWRWIIVRENSIRNFLQCMKIFSSISLWAYIMGLEIYWRWRGNYT